MSGVEKRRWVRLWAFWVAWWIPGLSVAQGPVQATALEIPAVTAAVQSLVEEKQIAAGVVLVFHQGRIIHFTAQGMGDVRTKSPIRKDSIFRIYSMTKPITSTAVMMLVDDGRVGLDDPIERHLPEFAGVQVWQKGARVSPKTKPTVRHLLTQTAGLTYGFFGQTAVDKMYEKAHPLFSRDNRQMVSKLARLPLLYHPGERWHYSMATDVLGHLVERVSGQGLDHFFSERIFTPLGMKDTAFFVAAEKIERFTSAYGPGLKLRERYDKSAFRNPKRLQSGGGGLVSTAADYLRFCRMLLGGGELDGVRLLKADSVSALVRNQLPKGVLAFGRLGFGFGVGVHLGARGGKFRGGEYGWSGIASTHFWVSPAHQLIVLSLTQRQPYSNVLSDAIKPLVYEAIAR